MNEFFGLLPALLAGLLLGVFFFGGLWWTVHNCMTRKWAALCFLGSLLLRTAVVLAGFYFVLGENWHSLLAGLTGFIIARLAVTQLTRKPHQTEPIPQKANHAP